LHQAAGQARAVRRIVALRMPTRYLSPPVERFLALLKEAGKRHEQPLDATA
jgi:hypothetical protein